MEERIISEIQNFFNKKTRPENNWNTITDLKNTGKNMLSSRIASRTRVPGRFETRRSQGAI